MTTSAGDWTARHLAAGVLVLLAAALVGTGVALTRVPFTAGLWVVLAFGIGLLIARRWALLLTFAPWPLGLALVFALGRHFYLSDTWWQGWLLLGVLPGLVGIAGGVALGRRIAALRGQKAGLALTVLAGVLLWLPFPLSAAVIRDAPAPPELADKLGPAKRMFANQLERRVSHVRFIGVQTRATDNLVVL